MRREILLLINGFGIEQAGSYNVYTNDVMPNLDKMRADGLFSTISNSFSDYKDGIRNFSLGIDDAITHSTISNNIYAVEYENNQLLKYIENEMNVRETNLHIFCYIDSKVSVSQLMVYLDHIKEHTKTKIFVHFVFCQKNVEDYNNVIDDLNKLSYEYGSRIKLGIMTGEENMNTLLPLKEIVKAFITESGEKWKDFAKKINVAIQSKEIPYKLRTFSVNYGCRVEERDQVLFFNFNNIDLTGFKAEVDAQKYRQMDTNTISYYSLFPAKCSVQLPFMYNYTVSEECFLKNLKDTGLNCLVIDKKENCSYDNYYLTGLKNEIDEHIKYLPASDDLIYDQEKLLNAIETYGKEIIILNYEIDTCKTVEEVKERLNKIDKIIGMFYDKAKTNQVGFYVTSLYGINKDLYNSGAMLCKINFYSKVPLILYDKEMDLINYSFNEGKLYDIANTLLFNLNKLYPKTGLLKKKLKIFSLFTKKPKKVEEKKVYTNVEGPNDQTTNQSNNNPQ